MTVTTGNAPVSVGSSSATKLIARTTGTASVDVLSSSLSFLIVDLDLYPDEDSEILIPVELSGVMDPIFPPPTPPVNFEGLSNPTVAPTLIKSDTVGGHLPAGTYRYSYAAWKGTQAQVTAPSPTTDITLTTEDTVTLTYPTIDGADGYLVYREEI